MVRTLASSRLMLEARFLMAEATTAMCSGILGRPTRRGGLEGKVTLAMELAFKVETTYSSMKLSIIW